MKKLFLAIRNDDLETVKDLLEKKPELISCIAKHPPKKDDGQSLLQVSLKCQRFQITDFLLSLSVDVNFIESDNSLNQWRSPVIHDAIRAAVMSCQWNSTTFGFEVQSTKEDAKKTLSPLEKMIEMGADVNAQDSYSNSCLDTACYSALDVIPCYNYRDKVYSTNCVFTEELRNDLSKIFKLLRSHGADVHYVCANFTQSVLERHEKQHIYEFLC